jgi:hypothetical protein
MGVASKLKDTPKTIVFWRWENSQIRYQDSHNGPFILQKRGVTRSGCRLVPTRLDLLHSREEGISPGSSNHVFLGTTLHGSVSVKYFGVILDSRLTWRHHVGVKVRKAHNLLWACMRAYSVTWGQGPSVVHCLYFSIIRQSINFAFLVRWPGCQTASAKKAKQIKKKTSMLRDNGSNAHHSH